ncbi:MAG: hypothetical protein PHS02_00710, partial [Candidatus ainarchaeum sp.]|nr:hypothetical protein [Candidatus ainarchaeum sp.]
MEVKKTALIFAAIFLAGVALLYSFGGTQNQGEKLVLYNGFAYYEQSVALQGGATSYAFELPYGVESDSVKLRVVNGYVVSQYIQEANYTSMEKLLASYVGKQVSVYDSNGREINGTLLKYDGRAYVQTPEGLFVITPSYSMLPGFSGNLSDKNASVVFLVGSGSQNSVLNGKLSYLMDSISWSPDYTLYLNGNGGTLALAGAVSNTAKDYDNVSLSLFYGQVRRTSRNIYYQTNYDYAAGVSKASESAPAPNYAPQSVSEYYKFDLGNVALRKGQSEFTLFEKKANSISKTYEMQVTGYSGSEESYSPLAIKLSINNSQGNGLGVALPAGNIRVMDENGFVGEDNALETANGENMVLYIGDAFDVVGLSRLMNQSTQEVVSCDPRIMAAKNAPLCVNEMGSIYTNTYTYQADVKNKKNTSADVVLSYSPYGDWVMVNENIP